MKAMFVFMGTHGRWLPVVCLTCLGIALAAISGAVIPPHEVRAGEEEMVSLTVTDGAINYGKLPVGGTQDTTESGVNNTQTVTNTSTVMVDFYIVSSDAIGEQVNWTLATVAGAEQYTHAFSTNGGATWTSLRSAINVRRLALNVDVDEERSFDLRIGMPTATADLGSHTITVYIFAEMSE
ncbi:MAG: hypothetical protein FJ006_12565 [Chloroflexi bacterium]|nr:hypothetical protein [Chloroflexota bacterium]